MVRLVLKLENDHDVPFALLMRDAAGESSVEVRLRVVHIWPADADGSTTPSAHFDDLDDGQDPFPANGQDHFSSGGHRIPRQSNIDDNSVCGELLPKPWVALVSSVMDLWRRVVARRQAASAPTPSLDDIDRVGGSAESIPFLSFSSSPSMLSDRMLARRLDAQLPEEGLDVDQVCV
jgi:hypothetical protein